MRKLTVDIEKCSNNYCARCTDESLNGIVVVTNKSLELIKSDISDAIKFHVEGCVKDGDALPEWLVRNDYTIVFKYNVKDKIMPANHINARLQPLQ